MGKKKILQPGSNLLYPAASRSRAQKNILSFGAAIYGAVLTGTYPNFSSYSSCQLQKTKSFFPKYLSFQEVEHHESFTWEGWINDCISDVVLDENQQQLMITSIFHSCTCSTAVYKYNGISALPLKNMVSSPDLFGPLWTSSLKAPYLFCFSY